MKIKMDKFGQYELDLDFSGKKEEPLKSEEPFLTKEEMDNIYHDEPGETDSDKLEQWYWQSRHGYKPSVEKRPEISSEQREAISKVCDLVSHIKRRLRIELLTITNFASLIERNLDSFVDYEKVKEVANNPSYGEVSWKAKSGLGAYSTLNSFFRNSLKEDIKSLKKALAGLKSRNSNAAIYIKRSPEYPMIKELIEEL